MYVVELQWTLAEGAPVFSYLQKHDVEAVCCFLTLVTVVRIFRIIRVIRVIRVIMVIRVTKVMGCKVD